LAGEPIVKIRSRFGLVLVVIVPALIAIGVSGVYGLQAERSSASELYLNNVRSTDEAAKLGTNLSIAHAATLELVIDVGHAAEVATVTSQLSAGITTDIDVGIATVRANSADNRVQTQAINVIAAGWTRLQVLRSTGGLSGPSPAAQASEKNEIEATYDPMTAAATSIVNVERSQAQSAYFGSLASYTAAVHRMLLVLLVALVLSTGVVLWLIRSVLTRTLTYSAFAQAVSDGDLTDHLSPQGNDELDQLGTTLDVLAQRRQSATLYDDKKHEFTDTLQMTEREDEAHDLLKRYLERTISRSAVTILNRNNSADRLEPVTAVPDDSPLLSSLEGAKPRSCLAVRMARTHVSSGEADPLLACSVCSVCPDRSMCTPLLVRGEVIGSVLVAHESELTESEEQGLREAVIQTAPVLGNLRNLAIAELRSATDALTGLPNRRAIDATLKRMVAQSSRSAAPLAALMCDLDHFKHINDEFGHGSGDDLLAAVGATFTDTLRTGDFVGRYGGEEFLILLPATGCEEAQKVAEKVRIAVADIRVATVDRPVTLSVGVAVLPDHAYDAGSLERAADRALYAAKNAGRNRVEVFNTDFEYALPPPEVVFTNGATGSLA
jgi:diguanylate cyclase (GGDEF)-like protein